MRRHSRSAGFSLVELMTVVAIVCVVAAVAARMYGATRESTPSFARTVLASLLDARHTALALGKPTEVYVTSGSIATYTKEPTLSTYVLQTTLNAPSVAELCTPTNGAAIGALATQPSCPATGTSICISSSGRVSVATGDPTAICNSTTGSSGATLFLHSKDGRSKYRIVVWGLTGMSKVIDQW